MEARQGQSFRERPGLGDAIVLVALVALLAIVFLPLRHGKRVGAAEQVTRGQLRELAAAARSSGLLEALAKIQRGAQEIADVEPFTRYYLGRVALRVLPTWEDNSYYYRLRLDEAASGDGVLVDAEPRKPGASGRESYHARDARRLESEPVLGDKILVDLRVEDNEARARERCASLAGIAEGAGLRRALRAFREVWSRTGEEQGSDDGYPRLATASHVVQAWPVFEFGADARVLELEIVAWPRVAGRTAFAGFRVAGSGAVLQSRNLVRAYDDSVEGRAPRPGAGMARDAARKTERAYLGVDGNHWFRAETHAAR